MSILIALVVIAVIVLVHELGHFIAARRVGIPVHEFSIGFGYKLFSFKKDGIEYSLRLIPLGGFVRMSGEEEDFNDPNGYSSRTPLEKIRVSFAGPFMNFVLAFIIFIYSYAVIGIPNASNEPVIGKVFAGKPADEAGLKKGDKILSINGITVNSWEDIISIMSTSQAGKEMTINILRDNQELQLLVTPTGDSTGNPAMGIMQVVNFERQSIINSIKIGFLQTIQLTTALLSALWILITGGASANDIAGPVGIMGLVGEAAQGGTIFLLAFTAFLSINLGIINLLPFPALDGSKIVFALIESIRKKPIEPEKEGLIHWVGFMFLMLIIIIATYNDILKLIKG